MKPTPVWWLIFWGELINLRWSVPAGKREGPGMDQGFGGLEAGSSASLTRHDVKVRYRRDDGRFAETTLRRLPVDDVVAGMPVREFRSYRGRRHYSGWYWSATTGGHVVYESRLELARILLADRDPEVVAIAAQPFLMEGLDGGKSRRHVPDLLLTHANGAVIVVDVKAGARLADPAVVAQFAWTRQVCDRHGFGLEVWSGTDPTHLENIRFLAGYRRVGLIAQELLPPVLEAAAQPIGIAVLERQLAAMGAKWLLRPAILHLLWSSRLMADLSRPLDGDTVVRAVVSR